MTSFGERWLFTKVPKVSELTNPITIVRAKLDPKTTGSNTEFNRTFQVIRKCYAKTEIAEIATTGTAEPYLKELQINFSIRKAPDVEIMEKSDYVIYRDKMYMVHQVMDNRSAKERGFQVLATIEVNDTTDIDIAAVQKIDSVNIPENPGFFYD
jgi:hypothetical protein